MVGVLVIARDLGGGKDAGAVVVCAIQAHKMNR
jgi:hypothetical protein